VTVINAFLAAESARNVDRALALFADDAVIAPVSNAPPNLIATGRDEIRDYLENLVAGYVEVEKLEPPQLVDGKVVWTEKLSVSALVTTQRVEAVVTDGKIKSLTVVEIMRASGRTVPWTGGSGWTDNSMLLGLGGLGLLALGLVIRLRSRQMTM